MLGASGLRGLDQQVGSRLIVQSNHGSIDFYSGGTKGPAGMSCNQYLADTIGGHGNQPDTGLKVSIRILGKNKFCLMLVICWLRNVCNQLKAALDYG